MMTPEYASPNRCGANGDHGNGRVFPRHPAVRAAHGPPALPVTSRAVPEIVRVVCESEPPRPSIAVARPAQSRADATTIDGATGDRLHAHPRSAAAAASPRRRPRQHRDEGDQQGAAAALRLGGPVRRGCPAPLDGLAGARAPGHGALSHVEVRPPPSRSGCRRGRRVPGAPRRLRRHRLAGAGRACGARARRTALQRRARRWRTRSSSTCTTPSRIWPGRPRRGG